MSGAEAQRFCGVCQKDVHDLSAMGHDEAQALLREKAGEHLCVRYTAEADGTLRFRDLVPLASLTRKIVRAGFAATLLAACTPYGAGPGSELGQSIIESIREATVPTPDGGCDYTTGPFTTFHLPPGHVLCKDAGPDVIDGRWPMATMGAPAPVPDVEPVAPVVEAPSERVKMGEAMAVPEAKDPFVPCDPQVEAQPGFAAPPEGRMTKGEVAVPKPMTTRRSLVKMGDVSPEPARELMGKIEAAE